MLPPLVHTGLYLHTLLLLHLTVKHLHPSDYFLFKLHMQNGSNISCGKLLASPIRVHSVMSEHKHSDSSKAWQNENTGRRRYIQYLFPVSCVCNQIWNIQVPFQKRYGSGLKIPLITLMFSWHQECCTSQCLYILRRFRSVSSPSIFSSSCFLACCCNCQCFCAPTSAHIPRNCYLLDNYHWVMGQIRLGVLKG